MDELTLEDKKYISSKRAAQITGYAKDYIGQLCRESKVEATQIGRNWYVLEDSIREHRFGVEAKAVSLKDEEETSAVGEKFTLPNPEPIKMPEAAKSTWQPTSYMPEVAEVLPTMAVKEQVFTSYSNDVAAQHSIGEASISSTAPVAFVTPIPSEPSVPVSPAAFVPEPYTRSAAEAVSSDVIAEMQSAWQDWFAIRKQDDLMAPADEELLESPSVIDSRNDSQSDATELYESDAAESEPVTLHKAAEASRSRVEGTTLEIGDEHVQLHRNVPAPAPTRLIHSAPLPVNSRRESAKREVAGHTPSIRMQKSTLHEARIVRERRIVRKMPASNALRALFIAVALVSVAIAIDGTGHFDQYLSTINSRFTVIRFLGGESFVNKA